MIKKLCPHPGCKELTAGGCCLAHKQVRQRAMDVRRGSPEERGYTYRWRQASKRYLQEHRLCVRCWAIGKTEVATEVDHILPHKGDVDLFWNESNWQALCRPCHSIKTATEDGGFGHHQ